MTDSPKNGANDRFDRSLSAFASSYIDETIRVLSMTLEFKSNSAVIEEIVASISRSLRVGGRVFLAGNGGSFADSQHLAAEFISKLVTDRVPLPAIALGTNSSAMSAIANDYGYADVFSRELIALGSEQDTFVAISTSGNSSNVLKAVDVALGIGIATFGLTGFSGGQLSETCRCIRVPSDNTAHIQEVHITLGHMICFAVERAVLGNSE